MPEVWQATAGAEEVSQDKLEDAARELKAAAAEANVWLLYGEMGSGKTTLVKAIGKMMGVYEGMSSPTFSIVNEYDAAHGKKIYHFDLYRIGSEREVFEVGATEYFDSEGLCLVEWPEKLGSLTPPAHFKVRITATGPLTRKIEYQRA
jgi:tRNA threonylcarbamoyladenosine biosynthesis protein TsaE